jgi:hypothetical protein
MIRDATTGLGSDSARTMIGPLLHPELRLAATGRAASARKNTVTREAIFI